MEKKLYRSNRDKVISGVCGGIAEYFAIDSTLIRLLWVLITLAGGAGIIGYIICLIVIPERPSFNSNHDDEYVVEAKSHSYTDDETYDYTHYEEYKEKNSDRNKLLAGIILIGLGGFFFLKRYVYWLDFDLLWPLLLIAAGVYIIYNQRSGR